VLEAPLGPCGRDLVRLGLGCFTRVGRLVMSDVVAQSVLSETGGIVELGKRSA
jgi:hypothetical protein